jgi:CheY-like chemotaxis protein
MGQTLKGNVQVGLQFNQPPPPIQADVTQLKQVLMNLCINARDAMPEGGEIAITVDRINIDETRAGTLPEENPGAYVVLIVADTGSGIPPEVMERIFDPFYTTKAGGKGTGLGLSTVRGIVKGHGGFLTVESQPGRGTTFRIHLPVAGAPAERPATGLKTAPTVLLVDDEEMIRNTLSLLLKSEGYDVCAAEDGNAALHIFRQRPQEIDLVITDLKMSGMDGYELIKTLRAIDAKLPIIALTGMADAGRAEAVNAIGARMLAKPMTRAILTKAVQQTLAAAGADDNAAPRG